MTPERLPADAIRVLEDAENQSHLSPVSVWETMQLARKRKLRLDPSPAEFVRDGLRRSALTPLPLTHSIAIRSEQLHGFGTNDPADRFLVATALEHDLVLVTADRVMHAFEPVETLW